MERLDLRGTEIEVVRRDIKHVHLSVHPPAGRVRIAAPRATKLDSLRLFAIQKLGWIRQQQKRMRTQERETGRTYVNRESHYVWGRRCLLRVIEADEKPRVEARPSSLLLRIRPAASRDRREAVVEGWYREQVREAAALRMDHWVRVLGVRRPEVRVQRMRTKWGSCNRIGGRLRLNTWLAKKPPECLDYIVLHELVHLLEPDHGPRFVQIMDQRLPSWRRIRERLNRLPTGPETWNDEAAAGGPQGRQRAAASQQVDAG
ncbi:MAG: M48 family metallopeptidase [Planctomycetes bacterium]|jgi:hypothetical protein|nr:M48 family metallopeptidase [Planctomycetota bacterium]